MSDLRQILALGIKKPLQNPDLPMLVASLEQYFSICGLLLVPETPFMRCFLAKQTHSHVHNEGNQEKQVLKINFQNLAQLFSTYSP